MANGAVARLDRATPTITLSRAQSGIGALSFTLVRPSTAGDLALGCMYQVRTGAEAVLQPHEGDVAAPVAGHLPLVRTKVNPDGQTVTMDLRQVPALRRALLYGFSPSGASIDWSGLIVVTTHGGARLEVPVTGRSSRGASALITVYNVAGELVLRSEMETFRGSPQRAAEAFGYRLHWIDGRPAA
ncbi:MAG: hypothetical protein ACT4PW_06310 [Acidimicrobiia bacterium]